MSDSQAAHNRDCNTSLASCGHHSAATAAPWALPKDSSSTSSGSTTRPDMLPPVGTFGQLMPIGPMASMPQLPVMPAPGSMQQLASTQLRTGRPVAAIIEATPRLPPAAPRGSWVPAAKRIEDEAGLKRFLASATAADFMAFILSLNAAITGVPSNQQWELSAPLAGLVSLLDTLEGWVGDIPPAATALRYGNPAFRDWWDRLEAQGEGLLARVLPPELHGAVAELLPYLLDSFGNRTRIDYGTGHETNFVALLYCLAALGVVHAEDQQPLVAVVFNRYVRLMRRVQTTYWLEPAGSHGVWGLDDYTFLAFLWGAAQLSGHPLIRPKSIHNTHILEAYSDRYLYLGAVRFVTQVKKGSLSETSPMLNDISGVPNWGKVNSGLVKMYQVEVLSKLPIMQHFLFGSCLPFPEEEGTVQQPQQQPEQQPAQQQQPEQQQQAQQQATGTDCAMQDGDG